MTPTTCTRCRTAPATLKKTAEPPKASAVWPNGVRTESRAIEPTTRRLISHPVRRRDAEQGKPVAQHLTHGAREREARVLLGLAQHAELVVPRMGEAGEVLEEPGDAVGFQRGRRPGYHPREVGEGLHEVELLGLRQN